jgi:hypothetical protein
MIRQLVAIMLLICSVSLSLSHFVLSTVFRYNQDTLAKQFCINKNRPQLHCNGSCYLLKKLKQAQDKEEQQDQKVQKIHLQEAVIILPFKFNPYTAEPCAHLVARSAGRPVYNVKSIFHPPQPVAYNPFIS